MVQKLFVQINGRSMVIRRDEVTPQFWIRVEKHGGDVSIENGTNGSAKLSRHWSVREKFKSL